MKHGKLVRIVVPVLIVMAIGAIWIIKNPQREELANPVSANQTAVAVPHDDFLLHATLIDLEVLKTHHLPIMIDFGADWCVPCRELAPVLVKMNAEMQGKAIIKYVDTQKYADIASGFPVQVIPIQVLVSSDGKPYVPSRDLGIAFTMYAYSDTGEHAFTVHQGGLTEEQMRILLVDMGAML